MLSKPCHGWAELTIGDWHDRVSYLDDVAFSLLESLLTSLRTHTPTSIQFDAEGYEYIVVIDSYWTHIITAKDNFEYKIVEINKTDVANQIADDIEANLTDWANFIDYGDMTEDQRQEREKDLKILCDLVRENTKPVNRILYRKESE